MKAIDQDRQDLYDFQRGKSQAAKALIGRYASPLLNQAIYLCSGDRDLAEDMVQNSFVKLWQNADKLLASDQELALRAWLFRVLRNQCLDHIRGTKPQDSESLMEIEDGRQSALAGLEQRERASYVMDLVERLPERQKSALLMAHFEAMSQAEIAKVLDCSVEAVENLLSRARRSLKQWVQEDEVKA